MPRITRREQKLSLQRSYFRNTDAPNFPIQPFLSLPSIERIERLLSNSKEIQLKIQTCRVAHHGRDRVSRGLLESKKGESLENLELDRSWRGATKLGMSRRHRVLGEKFNRPNFRASIVSLAPPTVEFNQRRQDYIT